MVKRILLPLDSSAYSDAATEYAIQLAKRAKAQVDGMVILDIPGIEKSIGPVAMGALYWADKLEKKKAEEAHEHVNALLAKFKKRCKDEGVTGNEAEYQGSPSELIVEQSIYYDIVVMGLRTYYKFGSEDEPGDTLDKVLGNTITPVLAVPDNYKSLEGANVLISFDGSLPAARALQHFAYFASNVNFNIKIINSSDDKSAGDAILQHAKLYLKAYIGKDVETIWTPGKIINVVNEEYLDWADLFVVGAHSKSGFLDFIVGSLTKDLIEYGKKIVFIG
jgi:nucleotide-binding universal stress UspA family protein